MRKTPLALLICLVCAPLALASDPDGRPPLVTLSLIAAPADPPVASSGPRVRPFRLQPGFLSETTWLSPDEPPDPNAEGIIVSLGNDNPCFDFRRRGDPGGAGYTRLASQVALFDESGTSCTFSLGAVSPSGQEFDGLPDSKGATVVMPALSFHQAIDEGMGLQVSVGGNLTVLAPTAQATRRDFQYGLSLYRSLGTAPTDPFRNVYLSVEAMGQGRDPRAATGYWEMLPGLVWKPTANWTLSGAMAMPISSRPEQVSGQFWQITCTLQF